MKIMHAIVVAGVMLLYAGTTFGEVVINEVPLKWKDAARVDGDVLYSNLCSACHGAVGKGDGPAVSALEKGVPDLTVLSANNDGGFPHKKVESVICGKSRVIAHGTIDMPVWGQQFARLRAGWTGFPQRAYVRERVHTLATYIETLQVI
jgi:mono/diheme cytochrome c family protein